MSRLSDLFVLLKDRTDAANNLNVDLFISNHVNAGGVYWGNSPYGDNPRDQTCIQYGIAYYRKYN